MPDFRLIETLLYTPGEGFFLLDQHLERMRGSCHFFGFPFPRESLLAELRSRTRELVAGHKVRCLLERSGAFQIELSPLIEVSPKGRRGLLMLSRHRTDPANPYLRHKTTCRSLYDQEYARAASEGGAFEILFENTHGELTEGTRTNLFIEKGGKWLTPPVTCGLLPGTMRASLLAEPARSAREQILRLGDLRTADRIFVVNSVQGIVEVEFREDASDR